MSIYAFTPKILILTYQQQLLKTLWEKKKLLVTSNFFLSHILFCKIRKVYPHLSIFLTSYLYLMLNWKSPKLAYEVKGYTYYMLYGFLPYSIDDSHCYRIHFFLTAVLCFDSSSERMLCGALVNPFPNTPF